jgi:hypothetical protein
MSQTRAELDRKLTLLQARAGELSPSRLSKRYVPSYFLDRVIGGILTLIGVTMAWSQYRGATTTATGSGRRRRPTVAGTT